MKEAVFDIATTPTWTDSFLALDVVRRISRSGRPVLFFDPDTLSGGDLEGVFSARPAAMVATSSVSGDPVAMRALERCRKAGIPHEVIVLDGDV